MSVRRRLTTTGRGKYRQYWCVEEQCQPPYDNVWHIVCPWTRDKESALRWLSEHSETV